MRGKCQFWFIYLYIKEFRQVESSKVPSSAYKGADLQTVKYPMSAADHEPVMDRR